MYPSEVQHYITVFLILCYISAAPTQVCITLLSEKDGKGDIVEAAREFCQDVQTKRRATKEMEPDYLNSLLKGAEQNQCRMFMQ